MVNEHNEAIKKIFVYDDNIVSLHCPECNISKVVNVSEYIKFVKVVRFKVKCSCGNSYPVILERREWDRKDINIQGTFIYSPSIGHKENGSMTDSVSPVGEGEQA